MNKILKNLIVVMALTIGFVGIIKAQVAVTGEFSSDITFGDAVSFGSPYTGVSLAGDGWELSTNLSDGSVNVEEAKYSWSVTDAITLTFGSQAEPYGLAWGLHRPSNNDWATAPRDHSITNGVGASTSAFGFGVQALYGDDEYWAARVSYGIFGQSVGFSVNSNDAQLVDVSGNASDFGFAVTYSLEYDLADEGSYWLRSTVAFDFVKDAFVLFGINSDDEVSYGVGYRCSDNVRWSTELSGDGDTSIRVSYSF